MRQIVSATALLVGTTIGAGIFALPEVSARAGVLPTLGWLMLLGGVVLATYLMYAEILERTPERHRLPGYAAFYLGSWGRVWAFIAVFFSGLGALLIYLILMDRFFLSLSVTPAAHWFTFGTWVLLSGAAFVGIRTVARFELLMAGGLIVLMTLIIAATVPRIDLSYLVFRGSGFDLFLPYGTILFALAGSLAIPGMRDLFSEGKRGFRLAILFGTAIPVLLYGAFLIALVGAFGKTLVEAELLEQIAVLGRGTLVATVFFGILAVATSYLATATYIIDVLRYDLRIPRKFGAIALFFPLGFFLFGVRDFPALVAFLGAALGLLDGALIVLIWLRLRKKRSERRSVLAFGRAMIVLFALGVVFELIALAR